MKPLLSIFRRYRSALALAALWITWQSALAATDAWIYSVKPGDTLIAIAADYLARPDNWRRLQQINGVADPLHLMPGRRLRLPVSLLRRAAAVAEVLDARGAAMLHGPAQPARVLHAGDRVAAGATVETGPDATLSLRFVDGSRLLITPNSTVTLSEMALLGKTGVAQTVMELVRGGIETRVMPQQLPAARYELHSRALNLAVRGTDFRARVTGAGDAAPVATSEVLEGTVHVQGHVGKPLDLHAGFGTQATPSTPPAAPQPLPDAPDLSHVARRLEAVPLHFTWPAAQVATAYHAQVFTDRSFEHLLLDDVSPSHGATADAKWADLPDGRYVLRVRAVLANGLEGKNADQDFVLKARPEPPAVIAPLDGTKSYGPEAMLHWSRSLSAESYRIQVSDRADFSTLLADMAPVTDTELKESLAPGHYYWRVASIAAASDQGPFADAQGFTQRPIPESPQLDAPSVDGKSLTFKWRAGPPGSRYQLQLARDADFKNVRDDRTLDQNQVEFDRPESGIYYVRIKTVDEDGFAGPFGTTQMVEVPAAKPWWMLLLLLVPLIH